LNICDTNSGHSPAELDGTGDPDGTPAPGSRSSFRQASITAKRMLAVRAY